MVVFFAGAGASASSAAASAQAIDCRRRLLRWAVKIVDDGAPGGGGGEEALVLAATLCLMVCVGALCPWLGCDDARVSPHACVHAVTVHAVTVAITATRVPALAPSPSPCPMPPPSLFFPLLFFFLVSHVHVLPPIGSFPFLQ